MPILVQIAAGGAIGAVLRHALVTLAARAFGMGFPVGTLAVNVLGCFAMGLVFVFAFGRAESAAMRAAPFLMPGLLGGFTTFSAFSLETFQLLERERALAAIGYAGGSVALCLGAVAGGVWLARNVTGT